MNAAPSISNGLVFRRTLRGFEPTDVDALVSELRDQPQQAEDDRAESDRRVCKRRVELTEARGCAAHVKSNFTELGTAFEETFQLQADAIRPAERIERDAEEILYEAAADAEAELGRQESTINQCVLGVKLSGAVPDTFEAWPYRSRVMRQASTPASDRVRVSA